MVYQPCVVNDLEYDPEERTAIFGEEVINFAKELTNVTINRPLIS